MAEIYNQQLDEIYENIGDLDIDSVNQSKAKQDILEADRRLKLAMDEAKKEALK